jgi:hypothetical protein
MKKTIHHPAYPGIAETFPSEKALKKWLCVGGFGVTVRLSRQTDAKACVPRAVSFALN